MKNIFFFVFISMVFCSQIMAQEFHVFVQDIQEIRTTVFTDDTRDKAVNQLKILTSVNGIKLDKNHLIKLQNLNVVDDKGEVLQLIGTSRIEEYSSRKSKEIVLETPGRQAKSITISGSLSYFTPNQQNKAYSRIDNFVESSGENLLKEHPENAKLSILTPTELSKLKVEIDTRIVNELGESNAELSEKEILDRELSRRILKDIVRRGTDNRANFINFKIYPSPKNFYSIKVFNEKDQVISYGSASVENLYQINLSEAPTAGSYIEVILENDAAIKQLDFSLENIYLP